MIKKELKYNFKSFIIWTLILLGMFIFVFAIYPFIINEETMESLNEMMKTLPPELLKSMNMDLSSLDSAYGWLKSEGFTFILLITGFYSSYLGISILLKEEKDSTIEYLHSLPIKRSRIVLNKIIVALTYIIFMVLIISLVNYIGLLLSGDFNKKEYLLLSLTPLFTSIPLFSLNLFISTLLKKKNKTIGISLGLVFIFYFLNLVSEMSEKVEFLKYISIYTLSDVRNVIMNVEYNPSIIFISVILSIFFITLSFIKYQKKELV